MSIELKITMNAGDKKRALAVLEPLARAFENPSAGLKYVGSALVRTQKRRFGTETDPTGKAWEKLSAATIRRRGATGPILRRSGNLMDSSAYQISARSLAVGVNKIYAGVQQFGATIKTKGGKTFTVPERPIVGFGDKVLAENAARANRNAGAPVAIAAAGSSRERGAGQPQQQAFLGVFGAYLENAVLFREAASHAIPISKYLLTK